MNPLVRFFLIEYPLFLLAIFLVIDMIEFMMRYGETSSHAMSSKSRTWSYLSYAPKGIVGWILRNAFLWALVLFLVVLLHGVYPELLAVLSLVMSIILIVLWWLWRRGQTTSVLKEVMPSTTQMPRT